MIQMNKNKTQVFIITINNFTKLSIKFYLAWLNISELIATH